MTKSNIGYEVSDTNLARAYPLLHNYNQIELISCWELSEKLTFYALEKYLVSQIFCTFCALEDKRLDPFLHSPINNDKFSFPFLPLLRCVSTLELWRTLELC